VTTQGDAGDAGHGDAAAPGDPGGSSGADGPVPRLPRGRGIRLSRPELLRVIGLAGVLVFLIVTQRPCANAVSSFVTSFGDRGSAAATLPHPGTVDLPGAAAGSAAGSATPPGSGVDGYEHLRPGMTDAEVKAVIERARARTGSASGAMPAASPGPTPEQSR
jgi:hypothetical protein